MMDTQYGRISSLEWCQREVQRIGNGARVEECKGECCIIRSV